MYYFIAWVCGVARKCAQLFGLTAFKVAACFVALGVIVLADDEDVYVEGNAVAAAAIALAAAAAIVRQGRTNKKARTIKPWEHLELAYVGLLEPLNNTTCSQLNSTHKKYFGIVWANWGKKFCYEADLHPADAMLWIIGEGADEKVDEKKVIRFITFCSTTLSARTRTKTCEPRSVLPPTP
jgi:hypothetical protein